MWRARERKKREVRRRPLSTVKAQVMRETQEIQKIRERHKQSKRTTTKQNQKAENKQWLNQKAKDQPCTAEDLGSDPQSFQTSGA